MSIKSFEKFVAFEASAGSGKTVALATRYLSLLFLGENPSSILAATFTNKAAGEMKGRIIKYLRELHTPELEFVLESVATQSNLSVEEILSKQSEILDIFLSSANSIVTLDSFFVSILRSMALEIGIEPDFVSSTSIDNSRVRESFLNELDIYRLLGELVNFGHISNKKLPKILEFLNTFYKSDAVLPKYDTQEYDIDKIKEDIDTIRLAILEKLTLCKSNPSSIKNFNISNIDTFISKPFFEKKSFGEHRDFKKVAEANNTLENDYLEIKQKIALLFRAKESIVINHMFELYDHYKNIIIGEATRSSKLSFDDIAFFTYRIMHELVSKDFLYFRLDAKYKHILLDEFQDTSMLQFLLLKPLIDEIISGTGQSDFRTLFYVGDTKQSLYRFRGGVEELFGFVANKYDVTIKQMDTNYRSSKLVVHSVNEWFEKALLDFQKANFAPDATDGYICVASNDEVLEEAIIQAKELIANGVDINKIAFLVASNSDGYELHTKCRSEGIATILKTKSSLKYQQNIARIVSMVSYLAYGRVMDIQPLLIQSKKEFSDVDITWFTPFCEPLAVIDRIVRDFDCYDDNVPILLEYASNYSDILLFLEEFKDSEIDVAGGTNHGAVIMTVHGSKGLEFGYTIVLDKFKGEKNNGEQFIFATDDSLNIDHIYYASKGRANFDMQFVKAKEQEELITHKDRLNVLYVALTRAVDGLIVVQKSKASRFGILELKDTIKGKINPTMDKRVETIVPTQSISISSYGLQENIQKTQKDTVSYAAVVFGTALHYALEMIDEFHVKHIDTMMSLVGYKYGRLLGNDKLLDIRSRVESLLAFSEFNELLLGAKVYRELPISFDGELKQIDILLEYYDKCVIVDYKSSDKNSHKHKEQVALYAKAITAIKQKPCECKILYLLENSVEIISLN